MAECDDAGSSRRPKRQSSGKLKKLELLERMKNTLKSGQKNKYELGELDSVYEEIDEREYSKRVLERQENDWIVDDDGCGYVEDGREIFDDDLDEDSVRKSKRDKNSKKRSRPSGEMSSESKKGNLRNLIGNMPTKRKKENIKLEDDELLGNIIGELSGAPSAGETSTRKVEDESAARDYMQSLAARKIKKVEPKINDNKTQQMKPMEYKNILPAAPQRIFKFNNADSKETNATTTEGKVQMKIPPVVEAISKVNENNINIKEADIKKEQVDDSSTDIFEGIDTDQLGALMEQTNYEIKDETTVGSSEPTAKQIAGGSSNETKPPIFMTNEKPLVKEEDISDQWAGNAAPDDPAVNINIDKSNLPLTKNKDGDEVLRFYYWDAHEEPFSLPGTVFLFGKVYIESAKSYVSCCVSVKNIERRVYLLPREKKVNLNTGAETSELVSMADVYEEFNNSISTKFKIKSFRSRKIIKKYCFSKEDVPAESEYLEVRYSASMPALPNTLSGETFSCVFGTNTSSLELFILDRGLKGPGWLEVSCPEPNLAPISWCKVEVTCQKPAMIKKLLDVASIPPLTIVTLVPFMMYNSKQKQSEVIAAAVLVNNSYPVDKPPPNRLFNQHFCVLTHPSDTPWPYDIREALSQFTKTKIEKIESERALLNYLLTKLYRIDADLVIGHDLSGYGIEVIMDRLAAHKVPNWSRFGRLRRVNLPHGKAKSLIERIAMTGRLLCDIKISSKELIKSRSYDLDTLCQNVLSKPEGTRPDMNEDIFRMSYSSGTLLLESAWSLMKDASYILSIFAELNVLPLALQITCIAGNVMSRTLMGGRSERNEFLLLHAFSNKDYIAPDKEYKKSQKKVDEEDVMAASNQTASQNNSKSARKKPTYAGGLVLDPKVGLYDDFILLMDFNSLYPSIIQEYNICFTTIPIASINMDDEFINNLDSLLPDNTASPGILPTEIRKLVESRREVKGLLKNPNLQPDQRMQYDIRQMALKLTANSMYGCLGFANSRFFAKPLAALVTAKGREILLNTKKLVDNQQFDVIYGDTDSLMINTRTKQFDQVNQIGRKIKVEVNKSYKQVELDIDGVFKKMLLLRKKKYAAITISKLPNGQIMEKKEMKGLDIVRRDWSQLSAEVGKTVLSQILSDSSLEDTIETIHNYLETIKEELMNSRVPLTLLTVTKQLTKNPEDYPDPKSLPHVLVALRMNKGSAKRFKQGDTVSYVICLDGTSNPAVQRAYHMDELKNSDSLKIDTDYYLSQQIHPVIARLCDPIEGTDAASIARCLGLDPSVYKQKSRLVNEDDEDPDTIFGKNDQQRFKDCERFSFICKNKDCGTENIVDGPKRKTGKGEDLILERCSNPNCEIPPMSYLPCIQNQLQLSMKRHIERYYQRWLVCDDPVCGNRTRIPSTVFEGAYPVCNKCLNSIVRREFTNLQLYNQLMFFSFMFDLAKIADKNIKFHSDTCMAYSLLFDQVTEVLKFNKYSIVDLSALFSDLFPLVLK